MTQAGGPWLRHGDRGDWQIRWPGLRPLAALAVHMIGTRWGVRQGVSDGVRRAQWQLPFFSSVVSQIALGQK